MKVIYIIATILILSSNLRPSSPLGVDNPAELAGYFYSWQGGEIGFSLPDNRFRASPKLDFRLYRYIPAREGFNLLAGGGYQGLNRKPFIAAGLSKRYSALYYGGTVAETGFDFKSNTYHLNNTTSMIYKQTGNLDYSLSNTVETAFGGGVHLKNRLTGAAGFNLDRENRFVVSLDTSPGIGFTWRGRRENLNAGISLDIERVFSSRNQVNLAVSIGFTNRNNRWLSKMSSGKNYRQSFSYEMRYGDYSPPITYSPTIFPLAKEKSLHYGLSLMKMIDYLPTSDIVITVRRGDYLNRISRNLPDTADESFRNNVTAIARYNDIRPPYTIHPGQRIKIPPKITSSERMITPCIDELDSSRIQEAIFAARTSDLIETRLNAALWAHIIDSEEDMMALLPVRADIENKYLLNTQALAEIELRNPKKAVRKLRFAITINPRCPVLNTNLAIAYILDNDLENAQHFLQEAIDLSTENGFDTSIHEMVMEKISQ